MSPSRPPPVDPPPGGEPPVRQGRAPALVVEDFRSLRRWLVLLGVLAVAAVAVAAYALIQSGESADEERVSSLARNLREENTQLEQANRKGERERTELARRLGGTSEESDVAKLDRRLRRIERDVVDSVDAAADSGRVLSRLDDRIDALSDRVTEVEDRRPRRGR